MPESPNPLTERQFRVPAIYIPQAWINDRAVDVDGAVEFDAEFYLAQLSTEDLDTLTGNADDLDVDQYVMCDALGFGHVSDHAGPYRVALHVTDVQNWREHLQAEGLTTPGIVRGVMESGLSGISPQLAQAIVSDLFDDNYVLAIRMVFARGRRIVTYLESAVAQASLTLDSNDKLRP